MVWLGDQFERYNLFRRLLLVSVMCMAWRVTEFSFQYAHHVEDKAGTDIAVVIAALTAPVMALLGYTFKLYSKDRRADNSN